MPDRVQATPSQLPRGTPRKNASSLAIPSVHWVQTAFFSRLLIRCSHVAYVLVEENYLPQRCRSRRPSCARLCDVAMLLPILLKSFAQLHHPRRLKTVLNFACVEVAARWQGQPKVARQFSERPSNMRLLVV